ncbi:hypothetical protein KC360_g4195 [Hortaea werneckii]|nr:hypothetical protein KC325_g4270 [Hortaea werneckii]KAI6993925.1 hypothetical protein KC359_g4899 [Hortaea werneckii]KAI7142632.1 hypothetical protein KC344_g7025 [Hortaea werneckii]KAI7174681.1 hypothetical protein KC360_g4195 [Hortaea werneckii]
MQNAPGRPSDAIESILHKDTLPEIARAHQGLADGMSRRTIATCQSEDRGSEEMTGGTSPDGLHRQAGSFSADDHALPIISTADETAHGVGQGLAPHRRNPLRDGDVQPQNDIERQWIMQQLRLKDLAAGRAQPVNGAEAEYVRQNRKSVVEPAKEKVSCESNRMTNVEESADVQDESIMIDHDVDFTSPRNPAPPAPVEQQAEVEMLSASQGHSRATTPVRDSLFIGSQEATSPHQSRSAQTVQEQLDFELAQRLQQELNGAPQVERNPERTAMDLQEAERQQDEFCQIQRRMARLAKAHISPFAPVLAKFIRYFDEQSKEQATREGSAAKPMTCGAPPRRELPGMEQRLKITDILSLEPEETCDERFTNAWLTDYMMDFLAADVRACLYTHGRKHFVPAQSTLNMWVGRTDWHNGEIISLDQDQIMALLEKKIADALQKVLYPDRANEKHDFPLADMPKDTRSVSLLYNIGDAHWVHILLQVDDEKKKGTITLHNSLDESRSGKARVSGQRPPKGQTLAAVERELPRLAHLICMRPSLGWQNVQWDPVTTGNCLQQANGSDCGIFAWTCASNLAMGLPVDAVGDPEGHPIFRGRERRWKALSALHFRYFGTSLPDVEEAWLEYGDWKALRENHAAWKAASVDSVVRDDDELAEEDNPPPTSDPMRETQQSTDMTGEPAAEDHASECGESEPDDHHGLGFSDKKRRKTLAKVRAKMHSSIEQLGLHLSAIYSNASIGP